MWHWALRAILKIITDLRKGLAQECRIDTGRVLKLTQASAFFKNPNAQSKAGFRPKSIKFQSCLSLLYFIPQMSRLVVAEIITQPCMTTRVQCIEKWAAVADICKCLHNFNGVLQIWYVQLCEQFFSPKWFAIVFVQGFIFSQMFHRVI
jgi:hypothetical protein